MCPRQFLNFSGFSQKILQFTKTDRLVSAFFRLVVSLIFWLSLQFFCSPLKNLIFCIGISPHLLFCVDYPRRGSMQSAGRLGNYFAKLGSFMCFFVGFVNFYYNDINNYFFRNDFLPNLPTLSIREGGIDCLLYLYKRILPFMKGYFIDNCNSFHKALLHITFIKQVKLI